MPVGFKNDESATSPKTTPRPSVAVDSLRGSSYRSRLSEDDNDADDDLWALFTRGLTTTYAESTESASVESEKPYGYYLYVQGLMAVLNVSLEELSLLKRIVNTAIDKSWDVTVFYRTKEDRFGGSRQLVFEESEFDSLNDRQKVQKDICFIYNILRDGYQELTTSDTYESTIDAIKAMFNLMDDENTLFEEYEANLAHIQELKEQLVNEKKIYLKCISEQKYALFMIKDKFEDKLVYGKYNVRYINDWESSRVRQNQLMRETNENDYLKIINDSNTKMNFENRVHNEITTWLETNTEDMTEEIAYWQQHYEEERDRRDLEIYNLKVARDQLIEDLEDLKVLYEKHRVEIEEWITYRDEKARLDKIEADRLEATIKIQAWWRGVMVRKHLGPFRKKKKGKKGKDKKKDKNKGLPGRPGGAKVPGKKKKK